MCVCVLSSGVLLISSSSVLMQQCTDSEHDAGTCAALGTRLLLVSVVAGIKVILVVCCRKMPTATQFCHHVGDGWTTP